MIRLHPVDRHRQSWIEPVGARAAGGAWALRRAAARTVTAGVVATTIFLAVTLTSRSLSRATEVAAGAEPGGMERMVFDVEGQQQTVEGRVLVRSDDDGVLLEGRDGVIWPILGAQIQERTPTDNEFTYLDPETLGRQLLEELGSDFQIHHTAHYVICYNTSTAYAQWCGALYEKLHRAFLNYWRRRGLRLQPAPPLVAVVFCDQKSYQDYGRAEVGEGIGSIIGYYSFRTNRIASYDLTGLGVNHHRAARANTAVVAHLNQILSTPHGERTVATLIHEATHQLAFNCGLQTRFADVPLWYSEGLAIYFETPDIGSQKGWASIGGINAHRWIQFRNYLPQRPADSLANLLVNDARFRHSNSADAAYAESWALCYYLIRTRAREFQKYTQLLSEKSPLHPVAPEQRLRDFQECFGSDLSKLDEEFIRYMTRLR